jgi:hypothetical protein
MMQVYLQVFGSPDNGTSAADPREWRKRGRSATATAGVEGDPKMEPSSPRDALIICDDDLEEHIKFLVALNARCIEIYRDIAKFNTEVRNDTTTADTPPTTTIALTNIPQVIQITSADLTQVSICLT